MVFALASIPGIIAVLVVGAGVREAARSPQPRPPAAVHLRLPSPQIRGFLLAVFVFTLGNSTDAFLLLRAQDVGVPVSLLPLLWAMLHVVKSATSIPAGSLSDRIGRKSVIVAGWLWYALVYLGFGYASSGVEIWMLFAAYGVFFGLTEGAEKALVADLTRPAERGGAFGFYHLMIGVAALPASLLFGLLASGKKAILISTVTIRIARPKLPTRWLK